MPMAHSRSAALQQQDQEIAPHVEPHPVVTAALKSWQQLCNQNVVLPPSRVRNRWEAKRLPTGAALTHA